MSSPNNKESVTAEASEIHKKPTQNKLSLQTILASVALIIGAIAIVEGIVFWLHAKKQVTQVTAAYDQLKLDFAENQNKITQLTTQAEKNQDLIGMEQARLEKMSNDILSLLKKSNKTSSDWQLLEINHLLRMADMALRFNRDVPGAIALLENAKMQLNNINDPTLQELQTAIATIVLSLKSLPTINLSDILTRINAIKNQITNLPLQITLSQDQKKSDLTESKNTDQTISRWRKTWEESLDVLKEIVVIRRHDKPIEPLINPKEENYLIQRLMLMLEQAQWAAIHGQEETYTFSLNQASTWIKQFYNIQNPATQSLLSELATLQKIQITRSLPDIAATQAHLQELINQRITRSDKENNQ